jgi:DNA-binding transcriptional LysR family regulator
MNPDAFDPVSVRVPAMIGARANLRMPRNGAPFYYDLVRTALNDHGIQPDIVVETTSPIARLSLVASGMSVTFALQSEAFKGVVARPVADLRIDFVGVLLSRRRVSPSSPLHTFRDILVATAQSNA